MIIQPRPGTIIRDPDLEGQILPLNGKKVAKLSPFWLRRLREGSILVTPEPAPRIDREEI